MINVSLNFGAKQGQIDLSTTKILKSNIHHLTSGVLKLTIAFNWKFLKIAVSFTI